MAARYALRTKTRQTRKRQLAANHGQRCGYCRRPFADLREATLDHIVPNYLWRTGTVTALMLACADCNNRKDDRFPLSIALQLLVWADPTTPVVRPADWPWLARLAHANEPTPTVPESADSYSHGSTLYRPTEERTAA